MSEITSALIPVARAIAIAMGDRCETVVHGKQGTIEFIENGHISGRSVGQKMEASVFRYLVDEAKKHDNVVVRLTKKEGDHGFLKSTTTVIFDEDGEYQAMLCFSIDLTEINQARNILDSLMNTRPYERDEEGGEPMDIRGYASRTISEIIRNVGKPSTLGSKQLKIEILRQLDEKGVFMVKDSIPQVCELLSISQATLYNYLREIRTSSPDLTPFR